MTGAIETATGEGPIESCARCGQVHDRCSAHVGDRPCRKRPIKGARVCASHGGKSPQVKAAAARRLAARGAARSIADRGYEPVADPLDALADLAAKAVALSEHFADRVAELDGYRYRSDVGTEQLRSELVLLEKFMHMAQKFLADWVRLGFEERKVRVDEVRAGLLAAVLVGVLRELGHDPQAAPVLEVLDRWLPVLDGGPEPALEVGEG